MSENRRLRPGRLVFPDQIDQILWRVDEFGALVLKLAVEDGGFLVRNHPSIDTDTRVFNSIYEETDPVFGAVVVARLDEIPVPIEFLLSLDPVAGVGDEISSGFRHDGNSGGASKSVNWKRNVSYP